jgi:hypothetical protein
VVPLVKLTPFFPFDPKGGGHLTVAGQSWTHVVAARRQALDQAADNVQAGNVRFRANL